MGKIRLLSTHEALKIAAGEVIERPAHIIKELLENSIDADSTNISLYVEKAGKKLIRIVDNGTGMSVEDAKICFLPHATSKITSLDDLEGVSTFGFRGEALSSIAAISKVRLITKSKELSDSALGTSIAYSEDKILKTEEISCPKGTDIQIQDLFFNTPVRKKFLKKNETEWNTILSVFYAFCLSNKNITFKLYHDGKLILNTPPINNIKDRVTQIWEYNFSQNVIPLLENDLAKDSSVKISGLISHHNFWRYGRNNIYFFVNRRWVRNRELSKGLMKGYLNVLPPQRFPVAIVFVDIDSQFLDVNVHPKKEEVKFVKPGVVQTALSLAVKKTLEEHLSSKISMSHKVKDDTQNYKPIPQSKFHYQEIEQKENQNLNWEKRLPAWQTKNLNHPNFVIEEKKWKEDSQQNVIPSSKVEAPKIIGQLFKTYIVLEKEQDIVFIDQHAAHERILYEKFRKNFESQQGTSLLFPEVINLSTSQTSNILAFKDFFTVQGINVEQIGASQIVVRRAPPNLKGPSIRDLIIQASQFIEEHESL